MGQSRGDGVEVVALVSLEAAGGPDFLYVRNARSRGESSAGAEKNRVKFIHISGKDTGFKRRLTKAISQVHISARSDECLDHGFYHMYSRIIIMILCQEYIM